MEKLKTNDRIWCSSLQRNECGAVLFKSFEREWRHFYRSENKSDSSDLDPEQRCSHVKQLQLWYGLVKDHVRLCVHGLYMSFYTQSCSSLFPWQRLLWQTPTPDTSELGGRLILRPIILAILVEITSNVHRMYRNRWGFVFIVQAFSPKEKSFGICYPHSHCAAFNAKSGKTSTNWQTNLHFFGLCTKNWWTQASIKELKEYHFCTG